MLAGRQRSSRAAARGCTAPRPGWHRRAFCTGVPAHSDRPQWKEGAAPGARGWQGGGCWRRVTHLYLQDTHTRPSRARFPTRVWVLVSRSEAPGRGAGSGMRGRAVTAHGLTMKPCPQPDKLPGCVPSLPGRQVEHRKVQHIIKVQMY